MRTRSWVLLAVGLLLSVVTAVFLYRIVSEARAVPVEEPTAVQTVEVVVAKVDIAARTVITADMLARKAVPQDVVPASALIEEAAVIGQTSLAPIPSGSFMLAPQLQAAEGRSGASLTVEPGKVLVAFPTSDPLTVAGLVSVGDRVDLLATIVSGSGEAARKTQTIVQNLEVLDVLGPTEQRPGQVIALTFVVDHQVALFLKYLRDSEAAVDVVVRSHAETGPVVTQSVDLEVLVETFGIR